MLRSLVNFLLDKIVPSVGYLLINGVGRSIRFRVVNGEFINQINAKKKNVIFAFWHNRLIMMPHFYCAFVKRHAITVMVSRSRDGQIITDIAEKFGFKMVRGSSSRGGKTALREMVRSLKSGWDGGYTPDGPRGPRYSIGQGLVTIAQLTGYPIIPVSYEVTRRIVVNSWDKLIIPMPFSRGVLIFGDPVVITPDANENVKAEKILELKSGLLRLIEDGSKELGIPCEDLSAYRADLLPGGQKPKKNPKKIPCE
jgi:hypothetical protein